MQWYHIVICIIYGLFLASYLVVETKNILPLRATNKILLASTYFLLALASALAVGFSELTVIIVVALFLALLGDCLLLFKKIFGVGVVFFLLSNIAFLVTEMTVLVQMQVTLKESWWAFLIFISFWGLLLFLNRIEFVSFGKYTIPLLVYIAVMTVTGSLGMVIAVNSQNVNQLLIGIGLFLFMISDYFLGAYMFKAKKHTLLRVNSLTYFVGIFLVALSVAIN